MSQVKSPIIPVPKPGDPYEVQMEKAEQRRKRIVLALGVLTFGGIFVAMLATFHSLGTMNQDIPGVFAPTSKLSAKAQPELALIHPPKPPTPEEFKQNQALKTDAMDAQEKLDALDVKVEVPVSSETH